jgi:hypothetical protein
MLAFCLYFSEAKKKKQKQKQKQKQDWEEEQEELVMILDSTQEDNLMRNSKKNEKRENQHRIQQPHGAIAIRNCHFRATCSRCDDDLEQKKKKKNLFPYLYHHERNIFYSGNIVCLWDKLPAGMRSCTIV